MKSINLIPVSTNKGWKVEGVNSGKKFTRYFKCSDAAFIFINKFIKTFSN